MSADKIGVCKSGLKLHMVQGIRQEATFWRLIAWLTKKLVSVAIIAIMRKGQFTAGKHHEGSLQK